MKIKANTSYNEFNKVAYSREFEVYNSIPYFINGHEVTEVIRLKIDTCQLNNEVFNYEFYEVVSNYLEDGDNFQEVVYICVKRCEDFSEYNNTIIDLETFEELREHEDIIREDIVGDSSEHLGCLWMSLEVKDGNSINVYLNKEDLANAY